VKTIKSHWLEIVTIVWIFIFMSVAFAQAAQSESAGAWGWGHRVKPTEMDFSVELIDKGLDSMASVNRHGEIAGTVGNANQHRAAFVNRQDRMVEFDCAFFEGNENSTTPVAINNDGTITGICGSGTFGFVRRKGGSLYQFSFSGADQLLPYGMNDREEIVVEYWMPFQPGQNSGWYRVHSAIRLADGSRIELKAPPHSDDIGAPHSLTRTSAYGINNRREVIGTYETIFTPSNTGGMFSAFHYSNGQFAPLPVDMWPVAINNDGTILMQNMRTGQFVLYDDNRLYTIAIPEPYKWAWIDGLTDKGELFGLVVDVSTRKFFNAIATPK
jgi:hypothetical protein